ncbi:hypothetical protein F4604DRAFT_1267518 [Suillus subluteus]|nr:hypothetical protein F4604DRAFT_1267518 [Suillus subluteus]
MAVSTLTLTTISTLPASVSTDLHRRSTLSFVCRCGKPREHMCGSAAAVQFGCHLYFVSNPSSLPTRSTLILFFISVAPFSGRRLRICQSRYAILVTLSIPYPFISPLTQLFRIPFPFSLLYPVRCGCHSLQRPSSHNRFGMVIPDP